MILAVLTGTLNIKTFFSVLYPTPCLLRTFSNNLDPDQGQQDIKPDLDPNCLTLRVFLKDVFKNAFVEKINRQLKTLKNFPVAKTKLLVKLMF